MPTVSVVIPTYNRATLVTRAIDSVLEQSVTDFELFIVDDGSTDDTVEIVSEYTDDRITLLTHETNRGGGAARNTGLESA